MKAPREKAIELVDMYYNAMNPNAPDCNISYGQAKKCALITVDEIINVARYECHIEDAYNPHETVEYWEEVKLEIENL